MTARDVASRLSEAQRRAVEEAQPKLDGRYVIPAYYSNALRIASPTFRRLHKLGLTERWPPYLTPLGLAVRQILKGQQ